MSDTDTSNDRSPDDPSATFTRLNPDTWGLRIVGSAPTPGQLITVTKKDGTTKQVKAGDVVKQDDKAIYIGFTDDSPPPKDGKFKGKSTPSSKSARPSISTAAAGIDLDHAASGRQVTEAEDAGIKAMFAKL